MLQNFRGLCARFVDIGSPVKTKIETGLTKCFGFRKQKFIVPDQAIFLIIDAFIHYEEVIKTAIWDPLTSSKRQTCHFLSLLTMFVQTKLNQK